MIERKIYEELIPYEGYFATAKNDFVRLSNRGQLEELDRLYKLHYKVDSSPLLNSCTRCVLHGLKTFGNDYFEAKRFYAELELKNKETENQSVTNNVVKTATNKRGRKPKNGKE